MRLNLRDYTSRTERLIIRATQVAAIAVAVLLVCCLPGCSSRASEEKIAKLEETVSSLKTQVAKMREVRDSLAGQLDAAEKFAEMTGSDEAIEAVAKIRTAFDTADTTLQTTEAFLDKAQTELANVKAGTPWWMVALGVAMGVGDVAAVFLGPKALVAWRAARGAMSAFNKAKTILDSGQPIPRMENETPKDARKRLTRLNGTTGPLDVAAIEKLRPTFGLA